MLVPIISEPVFEGADYVRVDSIEVGCAIIIRSDKEGEKPIGRAQPNTGALVFLRRALQSGEKLTATALQTDVPIPKQSDPSKSAPVYSLPSPLPKPVTLTTLYAGSIGIDAWGMVPGSRVRVLSPSDRICLPCLRPKGAECTCPRYKHRHGRKLQ